MFRGAISLSPDQMRNQMAKEQAILQQGRSFIPLILINPNMNRVQGAIVLHATPYIDSMTNTNKFHFEERGGQILFHEGMDGAMHSNILDCEHNRKFLASMYYAGYWAIEDKTIDQEIKDLAAGIQSRAVKATEDAIPAEKSLTDDELEAQAAKLNAELANRKLAKSEVKTKKPVRKIIDATADFAAKRDEEIQEAIKPVQEITTPAPVYELPEDAKPEAEQEQTQESTEAPKRGRRKSSLVNVE